MSGSTNSHPEFEFINWIKEGAVLRPEVTTGIGDDAALLSLSAEREMVTAIDVITEGVHFTSETAPELIGRKALAINLSDIAAMAAEPVAAFIGIVLPQKHGRNYAERIYRGLHQLASDFNVSIAGGDTNSWDGPLVLNVTLVGSVAKGKAVLRTGASVGDWLFVTGSLGGSFASGRHLKFNPRIMEAQKLSENFPITSMLDISDGLASDIRHLSTQSKVGFEVNAEAIPIHSDVSAEFGKDIRLQHALTDGEDFELLFTLSPDDGRELIRRKDELNIEVSHIGECTDNANILLSTCNGEQELPQGGWEHKI